MISLESVNFRGKSLFSLQNIDFCEILNFSFEIYRFSWKIIDSHRKFMIFMENPVGSSRPPVGSSCPPVGSSCPPSGSSCPPVGSPRPPSGSSRPPVGSSSPPVGSSRPPVRGPMAQICDRRSPSSLGGALLVFKLSLICSFSLRAAVAGPLGSTKRSPKAPFGLEIVETPTISARGIRF